MIKLILLTGFLGAGKTTLLKRILEGFEGEKVGVIVNEFGEVNVDAVLVQQGGIAMAELSNGSIFCACIKDHFLDSLVEMSKKDLDYLFIEASGLADPSSMEQILRTISPKTGQDYDYQGACCLVDPETHLDLADLLPALPRQIQYSSACIINKADLVSAEQIEEVSEHLLAINPNLSLYVTSYCGLDVREMVQQLSPSGQNPQESTNTEETRPKTFILTCQEKVMEEDLKDCLQELSKSAYRIKGFVPVERGLLYISAVGERISLELWSQEEAEHKLVVISAVGIRMISMITNKLSCFTSGGLKL